jgi:diguanylate cyclase (GGDEF)-like protein
MIMTQAGPPDQPDTVLERAVLKASRALSQAGPVFWVTFYGFVLIIAIALGTSLMIQSVREREIARSEKDLESTVRLLSKQFDKQLETFEAVPQSVAKYLGSRSDSPEQFKILATSEHLHHLLREKISDSSDLAGVNIFDSDGNFVNSSERWRVPHVSLADRRFFQTFKAGLTSSPLLIELVESRLSNGRTIVLARKVASSDGTFLGMVTRSMSPSVFESFFATLLLPEIGLALIHREGSLLAHYPPAEETFAKTLSDSPLIQQTSTDGYATMPIVSPDDGQERLTSARSLEHYPVYIVAQKAGSAVLAPWREETRTFVTAAGLAALIVCCMLIVIVKYLREQHRRLDIAVNNMSQGLLLYDASERLTLCNQRFLDMFQLSPEAVKPGCTLRQIIQLRKDNGSLIGDVDEYCGKMRQGLISGRLTLSETPDGRWMQIQNKRIPDGGWVTTIEDVTEQHLNEEKTVRLALYDTLTDLPNRALFHSHLSNQLAKCTGDHRVAVLFLDVDEFKVVNDTLGHKIGDELLKSVARSLNCSAESNEFVARLGGDEFAIVVSPMGSDANVPTIVQRLQEAIRRPHYCGSHTLMVDTSIGVAFAPDHGTTCDEILQNADLAMYNAKSSGKRTHSIFEAEFEKRAKNRRELEIELRNALATGSLDVNYQPIVDLQTNEIVGCEALARWRHEERGFISPAEFIPVAEQSGLIDELGEYVLRKACNEAAAWPKHMKLAVNVSPAQFKPGILALKVVAALAHSGLSAHQLELEITEAVLIGDDKIALEVLNELKSLGVRVALDDFGTGYSSLSYLRRFPFDKIKIDRSFINGLTEEDSSSSIVRAVVAMAAGHKMTTTAEGVETEQQREMLRNLNCAEMQGYLFSPARSEIDIRKMIGSASKQERDPAQSPEDVAAAS